MLLMTREAFNKAREYIEINGRNVDKAFFEYHFMDGSREAVLNALSEYQNEDGGFGKGIEPDFWLPESSPMATTIGFQMFRKLGVSANNPMVQKGIKYFLATLDQEINSWYSVPKEVNNYPHAPWWHYNEQRQESVRRKFLVNPSVEIIGYLHSYAELVPKDLLKSVTKAVIEWLTASPDKMEMHDMLCCLRMQEGLSGNAKEIVSDKLRKCARNIIETNPEKWDGYAAKPIMFVSGPNSLLSDLFRDEIKSNLNYEIQRQRPEGCWEPNWSWGQSEDDWQKARDKWKSYLTLEMLLKFKAFGYIENFD